VLAEVALGASHVPTGLTKHLAGDEVLLAPKSLKIERFTGAPG